MASYHTGPLEGKSVGRAVRPKIREASMTADPARERRIYRLWEIVFIEYYDCVETYEEIETPQYQGYDESTRRVEGEANGRKIRIEHVMLSQ